MLLWNRAKWKGEQQQHHHHYQDQQHKQQITKMQWRSTCLMCLAAALMLITRHQTLVKIFESGGSLASLENTQPRPAASTFNGAPTRYAYVFYAANDPYGCSALVNMARLRRLRGGLPHDVDLVLITSSKLSPSIPRAAVERTGALIYNVSNFPLHMTAPLGKFADYYQDSVDKFLGFLLPSHIYRRVILLDADCLILRPPHHLFELPDEIPFAAPKAYWYWNNPHYQDTAFWQVPELRRSRQDFLTSWIMSVRPSNDTFLRLQNKNDELIAKGTVDVYDMDLFNIALGEEITALPPEYGMLDFEFVENDNDHMGSSLDDIINGVKGWGVHFSGGMGKPMNQWVDPEEVTRRFPQAHAGYRALFQAWNDEAREVCPQGTFPVPQPLE